MFSYCCTRIRTGIPAAILSALFLRCAYRLWRDPANEPRSGIGRDATAFQQSYLLRRRTRRKNDFYRTYVENTFSIRPPLPCLADASIDADLQAADADSLLL